MWVNIVCFVNYENIYGNFYLYVYGKEDKNNVFCVYCVEIIGWCLWEFCGWMIGLMECI